MTKLEAVNEILRKTGGYPVAQLDTNGNSSAALIERAIDDADLELQSEGWHFNTRDNVELTPDVGTRRIPVPVHAISIDSTRDDYHMNVVQQGAFLYDLDNNTDEFDSTIRVKMVIRLGFDCIPVPVRKYIVAKAALEYTESRKMFELRPKLSEAVYEAMVRAKRHDSKAADVNILNTPEMRRIKGDRYAGPDSYGVGSVIL